MLEVGEQELGRDGISRLLGELGITREELADANGWFSLEFAEAFLDALVVRSNDPGIIDRLSKLAVSPRYLGIVYPLFRSFGTPAFTYRQLAAVIPRLNKVTTWSAEIRGPTRARITVRRREGAPAEQKPHFCRVRMVQLAEGACLFDLPPAKVDHVQCMHRGDEACVYDVEWKEHRKRVASWIGFALGTACGIGLAYVTELPSVVEFGIGAGIALGMWSFGRVRELQRDLTSSVDDLKNVYEALGKSNIAHEKRFEELLEAKTQVDKKVEQRTSELREASSKLSETLSKLQELDRAKTDFFNNVSHELRSPLTLILAPLDELISGREPASGARKAFESMHRNATRLLRLINQLLDLAKIDAGEMKIHPVPVDLPGLVRASLKGFESAAQKKGVVLTLSAPDRMPPVIVDPAWIDSAFTNLVANALRHTKSGGSVRVSVTTDDSHVELAVSDDGPGIAPADREKVFERFAQGDSSKRVVGGTGIGLALVREAMRMHGGEVRLDSELGVGSTFALVLPRSAVAEAGGPAPLVTSAPQSGTSLPPLRQAIDEIADQPAAADRPGPSPSAPLALIVDDNPELRVFIADALATHYRVRAAGDGAQGVELAHRLRPDVVVSDVAMPEMDGYELCRRLRAQQETKNIPVLLVTARAELANVLEGFSAGANDYLLKPFHTTELLARVDVHVRLRRLTAQLARQERLAALGSLAASVAHNVRNPLNALISGLPAMKHRLGTHLDAPTAELVSIMLDCAERIERMTLDLLDLSRIDREISGEFAPGVGLQACSRMFAARLNPDIELITEIDSRAVASGRAGEINHVFMNIIDNALLAVGSKGRIEVRGVADDGYYVVTVADSGGGIDPESIERIFEPFWTTRAAGEGTGLGLSIARQIVEEHSGTITAGRSSLGGALFTVRLPLQKQRAVA